MAAWYWFVIAGVAVLVIGGTIYVLTRGGDEEEAAAMQKEITDDRSLEEIAKDGLELSVGTSVHFGAEEDLLELWVSRNTCKDVAKVGDKEMKEEGEKDEEKADVKQLQQDPICDIFPDEPQCQVEEEEPTEDEATEDDEGDEDSDEGDGESGISMKRWWTVTGLAEGDCEIHLMEVAMEDADDVDWDDEDADYLTIKVTVGEAKAEKADDKDEEKEEDE